MDAAGVFQAPSIGTTPFKTKMRFLYKVKKHFHSAPVDAVAEVTLIGSLTVIVQTMKVFINILVHSLNVLI